LALRSALAELEPQPDEPYLYLRSFTEQRLRVAAGREGQLDKLFPLSGPRRPDWAAIDNVPTRVREWPGDSLLRFQCALLRVAADLGTIFGYAFSTSYPSVTQMPECRVTVDPSDTRYKDTVPHLLELVDAAAQLPERSAPPLQSRMHRLHAPLLKVDSIRRKLLVLTTELATEAVWDSPGLNQWRKRHETALSRLPLKQRRPSGTAIEVRLSRLEWLSDLLWYSLRFWIPLFPTTAELAFELSLVARFALPRRAELAQAAEALFLKDKELVDQVKPLFQFCEEFQERPSDFHLAIAAILQQMYGGYHEMASKIPDRRPAGLPPDEDDQAGYIPVAFTTNFDRCLEKAFEFIGLGYHVVYPGRTVAGDRRGEVHWFLRTVLPEPPPDEDFKPLKLCELRLENEKIRGPVIVKLHGSPLDTPLKGHEHWLVLSESGYLEAMDPKVNPVPAWVEDQLKGGGESPRSLWFLGYSVADWNIRLRLYEHLRYYRESTEPPAKSVVDRGALDWFREAILGKLEINIYQGDLNSLPAIVLDALSAEAMPRSDEVQDIVEEIGG